MKHTIASLTCLVENLQGQVTHLTKELDIVKKRSIFAANRVRSNNDTKSSNSLDASFNKLSPEAQAKAAAFKARMDAKKAATQQPTVQ